MVVAVFVCATIIFILVIVALIFVIGSELRVEGFLIDLLKVFDNLVA
jgi:hypothetical protein